VVTKKGQGYKLAEADPVAYHGPGKFDPAVGLVKQATPPKPTFTQVFGQWLCDMAAPTRGWWASRRPCAKARAWSSSKALPGATTTSALPSSMPSRSPPAGLRGLKPVVAIYSTFLQRGYDQLIHDVALQNLPVVFALDRAGLVGADGATHAGAYDIPYLRCIPTWSMACPADENECRQLLSTAFAADHPVAVRYPRGAGVGVAPLAGPGALPLARARCAARASGHCHPGLWHAAVPGAGGRRALDATVVNMRWAKPLDTELLLQVAAQHEALVTVEEGAIMGGAGSAVAEALNAAGVRARCCTWACDEFIHRAAWIVVHSSKTPALQACWPLVWHPPCMPRPPSAGAWLPASPNRWTPSSARRRVRCQGQGHVGWQV
jgi:1-deoxy-D-xylulose-5-phosphate synthase